MYRVSKSITSNFSTNDIGNVEQFTSRTITMLLEGAEPQEADFFKFYQLPQVGGKKFFYISNVNVVVDPNDTSKVIYSEITFMDIEDTLTSAGQKVDSFIQLGG